MSENPTPRIVAFTSGKGGCGKTTLATNFANTVFKAGNKVIIIDFDISNRGTTGAFSDYTSEMSEELTLTRVLRDDMHQDGAPRKLMEVKEGLFVVPASREDDREEQGGLHGLRRQKQGAI